MKKIAIFVLTCCTFILSANHLSAQCDDLTVTATNKTSNPDGTCTVTFNISFPNDFEGGTKEISLFAYPLGTAPSPSGWPTSCDLNQGTAPDPVAGLSFDPSNSNSFYTTYPASSTACAMPYYRSTGMTVTSANGNYTISGVTATIPGACNSAGLALDILMFYRTSGSTNSSPKCYVVFPVALPVHYGAINALSSDQKLVVNWESMSENNNDRYVLEGSKDGDTWHELGSVKSKALNGKSDSKLSYAMEVSLSGTIIAAGLTILLLLVPSFAGNRKHKYLLFGLMLLIAGFSCNKSEKEITSEVTEISFIRLVQYDTDSSTPNYSRIVKVIKE